MKPKALVIGLNNTFWDVNVWKDADLSQENIANKTFLHAIDCLNVLKEQYTLIIAETCETKFIEKLAPDHDPEQFEYMGDDFLTDFIKEKLNYIYLKDDFDLIFCKKYDCGHQKRCILHLLNKEFGYWNHELMFIDSNIKILNSLENLHVGSILIDSCIGITMKDINQLL